MGRRKIPEGLKKVGRGISMPPELEAEIEQIAIIEDRKWSEVLVKLAQKGLSLYEQDQTLFEKPALYYKKQPGSFTPPDDDSVA